MVAQGKKESEILPLSESLSIMETLDEIRRQIGLRYVGTPLEDQVWGRQ